VAIRVGIVDDHPAMAVALEAALTETSDMEFVGSGRDVPTALELAARVDVLLCDLQLAEGMAGLRILASLHDPTPVVFRAPPAVIVLTSFDHASLIRAALDAGAAGYLHKSLELSAILEAIRTVAAGGTAIAAEAMRRARTAPRRPSGRELDVIQLVVGGASNGEIASRLGISEKTVESHLRRLFDRYGLLSRTELAVMAYDEAWAGKSASARTADG
jgi:DNA-binding NarL/FixJ family response regulator